MPQQLEIEGKVPEAKNGGGLPLRLGLSLGTLLLVAAGVSVGFAFGLRKDRKEGDSTLRGSQAIAHHNVPSGPEDDSTLRGSRSIAHHNVSYLTTRVTVDLSHVTPMTDSEVYEASELLTKRIHYLGLRNKAGKRDRSAGLIDESATFEFEPNAEVLTNVHPHGFIAAATAAFAKHWPLSIRPQHFWLMILQAMAVHVNMHSEELRELWVAHEGKKQLVVVRNDFQLESKENNWEPKNNWSGVVYGAPDSFAAQIDQMVVAGVSENLYPHFTNSTRVETLAMKVTVMDMLQSYSKYKMQTMCGFPRIILEGSLEDWLSLRRNAEQLINARSQKEFATQWSQALIPLLDKFVEEYRSADAGKEPDERFWNSMVKMGGSRGSGRHTWFNGWINILFPYIRNKWNRFTVPYSIDNDYVKDVKVARRENLDIFDNDYVKSPGPDTADFPNGLAAAPVSWNYFGQTIELKFKAGFVGATQESRTGTIKPVVGWFVAKAGTDSQVA